MSRSWAAWTWQWGYQLAAPRRAIVIAFAVLAAAIYLIYLIAGRFPIDQPYEVVSINGRPLPLFLQPNGRIVAKYRPTLRVIVLPTGETRAGGSSGCNSWNGHVVTLRSGLFILGGTYHTAIGCSPAAMEIERDFDAAFARVIHWRRERAELVLEGHGTEIRLRPPVQMR